MAVLNKYQFYSSELGYTTEDVPDYTPRTQKVKGLQVLNVFGNVLSVVAILDAANPKQVASQLARPSVQNGFPYFARPCPLTPRHGFVDSRVVKSSAELMEVIHETHKADPKGEVMLTKFLESSLNMIWTPAFLTIGEGHDGATIGKNTLTFPLSGVWDPQIKSIAASAGVNDYPYVEAVVSKNANNIILTQLRNGPKLDRSHDFIPDGRLVDKVILTTDVKEGDLLAWEELMLKSKGLGGVVVYHPGGSQADHFSIHARSCGVPCITTFKPTIGMVLTPSTAQPIDYAAILKGMIAGDRVKLQTPTSGYNSASIPGPYQAAVLMMMGLHNSSAMEGEDGWWLGASISLMLRLGSMALRGEARHLTHSAGQRGTVYAKAAKFRIQRHKMSIGALVNIFRYGWQPGGGGIGGTKWAECGVAMATLFEAVRVFVLDQNAETYGGLLRAFNVVINQAHNGGWWMNKFVDQGQFKLAQSGSMPTAMLPTQLMWELGKVYNGLSHGDLAHTLGMWREWKPVDLAPSKIIQVEWSHDVGDGWLSLSIKDRLLGKRHVPLQINATELFSKLPEVLGADFYVLTTPAGLALEMVIPGITDTPVRIWSETPLKPQEPTA